MGFCILQVRGEEFVPWRQPRLRMPRRSGSTAKRMQSPPRRRGSESGGEHTETEDELRERRSKQRHDPRYAAGPSKERGAGRAPPKRRRRVVDLSSGSEDEPQLEQRGEDSELVADFRYSGAYLLTSPHSFLFRWMSGTAGGRHLRHPLM